MPTWAPRCKGIVDLGLIAAGDDDFAAPNTRASWIAVEPMPLEPPWMSIVSPARSRARSKTLAHAVKRLRHGPPLLPRAHAGSADSVRPQSCNIPRNRHRASTRADAVANVPAGHRCTDGNDFAGHLETHDR